jgi:outer membrane lipoprotein LolB
VIRGHLARLTLFVAPLWLAACATTPTLSPQALKQSWQAHRSSVARYQDWALSARIAVSTEDDAWSGQLKWHQAPQSYEIFFTAPFGQGAVQLAGDRRGVEMRAADGQVFFAPDAESLLYQQLGWRLPLAGLRYWVVGLPVPQDAAAPAPEMALDEAGRLASLKQAHWRISYPGYRQVEGVALPQKVFLENTELSVRLVIDRWQLKRDG